jgi:hypothetical protein
VALPVVFPVPVLVAQHVGPLRHALGSTTVMNKIPLADSSPERDDHCGGPEPSELLVTRPKAAFHWPPDCAWPFMDHGRAGDTYTPCCPAASPMNQWRELWL